MNLIYLASPYSHVDPKVRKERFKQVSDVTVNLIKAGLFVYAPIAAWHTLAESYDLPVEFDYWQKFDELIVSRSNRVLVLTLNGWEQSKGVQAEIAFAKSQGIPTFYITYEQGMNYE